MELWPLEEAAEKIQNNSLGSKMGFSHGRIFRSDRLGPCLTMGVQSQAEISR